MSGIQAFLVEEIFFAGDFEVATLFLLEASERPYDVRVVGHDSVDLFCSIDLVEHFLLCF